MDKPSKILIKFLLMLPYYGAICYGSGYSAWFFFSKIESEIIKSNFLILGIIIAAIIFICVDFIRHVLAYQKLDNIKLEDYLESKHEITLPNHSAALRIIYNELESVFSNAEITDEQDKYGYRMYLIQGHSSSFLKIDFKSERIRLSIKRTSLSLYPDRARNYKLLMALKERVESVLS